MIMRSHFLSAFIFIFFLCAALLVCPQVYAQYSAFGDPGSVQVNSGGGAAGLVPVEPRVDGGSLPTGASGQVVVRFRNDGGKPVQTGLIRLYPSSTVTAEVSMNQCEGESLPVGAECAIALSIKGLQAGQWRVEMLMSHSGRARLVTATLTGSVEAVGEAVSSLTSDVEAIPNTVDFGSLETSQALVESVILRNVTSQDITVNEMYIDSGAQSGYSLKADCKELAAGQACMAVITWAPNIKGRSSGVLVIKHSGAAGLSSVPLSGQYNPSDIAEVDVFPSAVPGQGLLAASKKEIDFGSEVNTVSTITVSLVNTGDDDLMIEDIRVSGSDSGVGFKSDGCANGVVLAPIEACPLTINWSPTRVGALVDDIQISHTGTRGVLVLPVRGTSIAAVSQDQGAIMLTGTGNFDDLDDLGEFTNEYPNDGRSRYSRTSKTRKASAGVLDGYKITSFSSTRAIINGPGGSRIVFDNEEVLLGGVAWFVEIQKGGIEFSHEGQRVLLLFDRSLSPNAAGVVVGVSVGEE